MYTRTICNVVINTHRKRVRLLEHHANSFPKNGCIYAFRIDILIIQFHFSCDSHAIHQIIHPV